MKGNVIISSANPQGKFQECIVSGTPKPGTCMEMVPATIPVNGAFTFRHASRTAGSKGPICVLLPDQLQGKGPTDAYVSGTRGFLYWPIAGEMLNMRVLDIAGTGDDVAIGDLLGVEATTGELHANSSYASAPFAALEVITDPAADYLLWCQYLGNLA